MVPRAPCQMDKDATPAPLLGVLSLTPVTQGTQGLQVVLVEHVSQVVSGQGLIQLVHVSPYYVIIISFTVIACKIIPYLLADYKYVKELCIKHSKRYTVV